MNNKKIYIAIAIVLVIALLLVFILNFNSIFKKSVPLVTPTPSQNTNTQNIPSKQNNSGNFPTTKPQNPDNIVISTGQGDVEVKDPKKNSERAITPENIVMKELSDYQIIYFDYQGKQAFLISILGSDIENIRKTAENDLLTSLDIKQDQACKLDVSISVSKDVNEVASGKNYGLSFCPNGKPFPKQ